MTDDENNEEMSVAEMAALYRDAEMPRIASSLNDARQSVELLIGKPLTNERLGITAVISGKSLRKMTHDAGTVKKSASPELHTLAVANIDVLFSRARFDMPHADAKENRDVKQVHRLGGIMKRGADFHAVKITVKEFLDAKRGARIYSVEALRVEKLKSAGQPTDDHKGGQVPITDSNRKFSKEVIKLLNAVKKFHLLRIANEAEKPSPNLSPTNSGYAADGLFNGGGQFP
ncbi:MAG: hypothetical protein LBP75_03190 [Planctomycetota bacterium]|jgi:hypothetical protein|nr:hypothetical protein [Planctomycetota bacterium]